MNNTQRNETNIEISTWNINGLNGKQKYIQLLLNETRQDIAIFSETKMKRPIIPHVDIGSDEYNIIQLKSTPHGRGGMVILMKHQLKLYTVEVVRKEGSNEFIQAIIVTNKKKEFIFAWYSSPGTSRQHFHDTIKRLMKK